MPGIRHRIELTVRPAQSGDAEALAKTQVDSYRLAYRDLLPDAYLAAFSYAEQAADWRALLADPGDRLLWVAETDGGAIGYALATPAGGSETPGEGELIALHVRREWQGRGIGRALVAAAAAGLQARGCKSLMLRTLAGNRRARTLYENLGGQPLPDLRTPLDEFDCEMIEAGYRWPDIAALVKAAAGPAGI
jgi:GNAT superfamily N-acetyltransferase